MSFRALTYYPTAKGKRKTAFLTSWKDVNGKRRGTGVKHPRGLEYVSLPAKLGNARDRQQWIESQPNTTFDKIIGDDDHLLVEEDQPPKRYRPRSYQKHSHKVAKAVADWKRALPALTQALADCIGQTRLAKNIKIRCNCSASFTSHRLFRLITLTGIAELFTDCCSEHLFARSLKHGAFPSSATSPALFFDIDVLNFYHQLWHKSGISVQAFCESLVAFHDSGTSTSKRYGTLFYKKEIRKQFGNAYFWYRQAKLNVNYTLRTAKGHEVIDTCVMKRDGPSLAALVKRCPACFQHFVDDKESGAQCHQLSDVLELIVCLDGNFQHKRRQREDASEGDLQERIIMLPRHKVADMEEHVNLHVPVRNKREQGCLSNYKAANETATKATSGAFDVTGLMLMSCRHDIPLFACDIYTPGERQFYALALLKALFECLGDKVNRIGVLYDIACTSARYIQTYGLVPEFASKICWATSIFHSFGHDYACQMGYSPRYASGFGLSNGEGNERLWSTLANIIGKERSMSAAHRHVALESRMHRISQDKIWLMANHLSHRLTFVQTRQRAAEEIISASAPALSKVTESMWQSMLEFTEVPVPSILEDFEGGDRIWLLLQWRAKVELRHDKGKPTVAEIALDKTLDLEKQIKACEEQIQQSKDAIKTLSRCSNPTAFSEHITQALSVLRDLNARWRSLKEDLLVAQNSLSPEVFMGSNSERVSNIRLARVATSLGATLAHWHMDNSRLKGDANYPLGTRVHTTMVSGMQSRAATAKRLLDKYNTLVALQFNSQLGKVPPYPSIQSDMLFKLDTLQTLHRLCEHYGESESPWRFNSDIQTVLEAASILLRCYEEKKLLQRESSNINQWHLLEMKQLKGLSTKPIGSLWLTLVKHEQHRLERIGREWKAKWNSHFGSWVSPMDSEVCLSEVTSDQWIDTDWYEDEDSECDEDEVEQLVEHISIDCQDTMLHDDEVARQNEC